MNITKDGLEFQNLDELLFFANSLSASNVIKFKDPIEDNAGNILIKEDTFVKESMFKKLTEMEGQYRPHFQVVIGPELHKQIALTLTEEIMNRLKKPENSFLDQFFHNLPVSMKGFILHSFVNRSILLSTYKTFLQRRSSFYQSADNGLTCLAIILLNNMPLKYLRRHAFLCGFMIDLGLSEQERKITMEDPASHKMRSERSARLADNMGLPLDISDAIRASPLKSAGFLAPKTVIPESEKDDNQNEIVPESMDFDDLFAEEVEPTPTEDREAVISILADALRLALFITDASKRIEKNQHFAEELLYMTAYNAARGYLHEDLAKPIIRKFREYEKMVQHLSHIAELERRCIYMPSAWAYPKPRATQILCKNHVVHCPKLVQGWDIHVISPQDALGWIGMPLAAGNYSKCELEYELKSLE